MDGRTERGVKRGEDEEKAVKMKREVVGGRKEGKGVKDGKG